MHVGSGESYYEQMVPSKHATSPLHLSFYTYAKNIVNDTALSRNAIDYFVEALTPDKYFTASRFFVGLSLIRTNDSDYVVGYVLNPDKMTFEHFDEIRVDLHYQFRHAKIVTLEMIGTSHLSC